VPGSPRVSVIVPLYQKSKTVERTMRSILAQHLSAFEVIVVDDGSTDGGAAVAQRLGDPRIRVLTQTNAGPGAARNRGTREALAPIVAYLDADDTWDPSYLARLVPLLEDDPALALAACAYVLEPQGTSMIPTWRRRRVPEGTVRVGPAWTASQLIATLAFVHPGTTVARRDTVLAAGGFWDRDRRLYGEDGFLFLKMLMSSPVAIVMETHGHYYADASELATRHRPRQIEPLFEGAAELDAAADPELRPLLRDVLAIRAGKTSCVMAYWGRAADARQLMKAFRRPATLRYPWVFLGHVAASPLGRLTDFALSVGYSGPARGDRVHLKPPNLR
jgi:glycosyltransferase involved in cell wall biosynthesis